MLRALGLKSNAKSHVATTPRDHARIAEDGLELEYALIAMDAVLDGQLDEAETFLKRPDCVFNRIATGVLHFIQATVSFEPEAIQLAVSSLSASESLASKAKNHAHKEALITSRFRPGCEFEMAELESALLGAISMLLTESKFDIVKALYKIRKTYLSLEELRKHIAEKNATSTHSSSTHSNSPSRASSISTRSANSSKTANSTVNSSSTNATGANAAETVLEEFSRIHALRTARSNDLSSKTATPTDTIEEYICSGVSTMSGLLHLILSSVPPNIARLLSVAGLSGDRDVALNLLWTSAKSYRNIHGSLALIALIMFFDSQLQYADIVLSEAEEIEISKNAVKTGKQKKTAQMTPIELRETKQKLLVALQEQRTYYPHGVLWLLLQGRLVTHDDVAKGVAILESDECGPNQMRQVEGLLMFDHTLFLLVLNRLQKASNEFINLMDVSTWSHPLYMYMAGACQLEQFRACDDKGSPEALAFRDKAREYFKKAPHVGGKKKVLGRKMPFDTFVQRKMENMQKVADKYKLDLVDAVGPSPVYEALYFWNGPSRMDLETAKDCVNRLQYSANAPLPESDDDKFTRELLQAVYMRRAGMQKEGFVLIEKLASQVVSGDVAGTGNKRVSYTERGEPWAGAACLYERAVYEWWEFGKSHVSQVQRWLKLSSSWSDDYELSTRINMKITLAEDRLDIYRL